MCGRYTINKLEEAIEELEPDVIETALNRPRYNAAPTQNLPVFFRRDGQRVLADMRWGLIPAWADDPAIGNRMINARAETLATKPSYKAAFRQRRCLVPVDGFYEWRKTGSKKQPMLIHRPDHRPMTLAGLYEIWHGQAGPPVASFTIITVEPNDLLRDIHNRMPAIMPAAERDRWLDPGTSPDALQALLRPFDAAPLQAVAVGTRVNSPACDDPDCIRPIE